MSGKIIVPRICGGEIVEIVHEDLGDIRAAAFEFHRSVFRYCGFNLVNDFYHKNIKGKEYTNLRFKSDMRCLKENGFDIDKAVFE